ncbi:MAG: penicillin-binding transpeptidase domain-containing protein, partial [Prevotella sp.]
IKTMQTILEHVVSQGLGKRAGSKMFKVAGKTGTAQVSKGKAGYKSGVVDYWLSFAGYFPADKPRYTCIVCIQKSGLPASGGGMSGVVFHHIAEGVMSRDLKLSVENARDTLSVMVPDVKNGNIKAADFVLGDLNIKSNSRWGDDIDFSQPLWGTATRKSEEVAFNSMRIDMNTTPDVTGMGARDAVYLLESRGLKVRLQGRGKVKSQSYPAGRVIAKGAVCTLIME